MNKPKTTVALCSSIGQIPVQFLLSEADASFLVLFYQFAVDFSFS